MEIHIPQGAIQGLCSASMTLFALGMAFLGYWGFANKQPWTIVDAWVVIPTLFGFLCLTYVPWILTSPEGVDEISNLQKGRKAFLVGGGCILFAVFVSLFI